MNVKILGIPIFKMVNVEDEKVKGIRIVVLGLLHTTITYGIHQGDHIHLSLGFHKLELFGGLTIWS
jgi:hypothetical protein